MILPEAEGGRFQLRDAAVSWCDVDGEIVAFNISLGVYITLNGAGRQLWMALTEPASADHLGELLASTFGIPAEQARSDALEFLDDLVGRELVEAVASRPDGPGAASASDQR
jgi:hypothetical protein